MGHRYVSPRMSCWGSMGRGETVADMFPGHGRGCLFIIPHLDILYPSILCSGGNIEVRGERGLVDGCSDGTTDDWQMGLDRVLTSADRFYHLLCPVFTGDEIWTRCTHGQY